MITIKRNCFDLNQIYQSGQCFRMDKLESTDERDYFCVVAFDHYLSMSQDYENVYLDCPQEEYDSIWRDYFDMDTDYQGIIDSIDKDDLYLRNAASFGHGIRILRQDLWEMIITFIISQQNNVGRIKKCVNKLCEMYGIEMITDKGIHYYTFPTVGRLSQVSEDELKSIGLGYRAGYIHTTSAVIANDETMLTRLHSVDYSSSRMELLKLRGVGAKVADCICLFALHHTEAFPIDVHIKNALEANYTDGFPFERYIGYAGILQQYMFYYDYNH